MAIITSGDIKIENTLPQVELEYNIEIDLENKTLNKMNNFPTVVVGDNNSVSLVFKAPLEYQGVDLYGTNCVLSYDTTWIDENKNPSSGQIDLTNTCIEKDEYLLYTWVLDIKQTHKIGNCNFNIHFLMNLEEDPYTNNTNVFIQENEDSSINFGSLSVTEANLKYWSISCTGNNFTIGNTNNSLNSDYNLVLPDNLAEQLEEAEIILKESQELLEEIKNTGGSGGSVDLTDYVKNTDIEQNYNAESTNAQSGIAVAQALATVEGIKTISESVRIWDLEQGIYKVPANTTIHAGLETQTWLSFTTKADNLMTVSVSANGKDKTFALMPFGTSVDGVVMTYGVSMESSGQFGSFNLNSTVTRNTAQTIYSEKTFTVPTKMTAELAANDNSTNIPNTAWVQIELSNKIGNIETLLGGI